MKKYLLSLCFGFCFILPSSSQQAQIQKRTTNPFAFSKFRDATVTFFFNRKGKAEANIFLKNSKLCFMQNGKVMEAFVEKVLSVDFGNDIIYMKMDSIMGRVIAQKKNNYLLRVTTIDLETYKEETGNGNNLPYFSMEDFGVFIQVDGDAHETLQGYPLKNTFYFIHKGKSIPAVQREFKKYVRADKKLDFRNLMNDKYWSWKDEESLKTLLDYL